MTACTVCGTQIASYVCSNCGCPICVRCFDTAQWRCINCATPIQGRVVSGTSAAIWLFFLAFFLISAGILLVSLDSWNTNGTSGGAVILLGPIPIILGSGPYSVPLIILATILTLVTLIVFVRRFRA